MPNAVHYVERIAQTLMDWIQNAPSIIGKGPIRTSGNCGNWTAGCWNSWPRSRRKTALLVTYHNAFAYFAQRYGFTAAPFLVHHPDREPTAKDMAALVKALSSLAKPVVFAEPQFTVGERYVQSLAEEIGGEVRVLLSATLTAVSTYVDLMRYNGQVLLEALR